MTELNATHHQAMDLAEEAHFARLQGEHDRFHELSLEAFEYEWQAARLAVDTNVGEPTRSVLLRSAATIAMDCGRWRDAERIVSIALSADPPEGIANELRDLLERVHFDRHLELRGVSLSPHEVQMSLTGPSVSFGVVDSGLFLDRISSTQTIIRRTAERKLGRKFSERGRHLKRIEQEFSTYLTVPRAASFAVSIRVGTSDQLELPGIGYAEEVIDEIMTCLRIFEDGADDKLKDKIGDERYYRSFLGLARQLAPDGTDVRMVGFTTQRGDRSNCVKVTRTRTTVEESATKQPPREYQKKSITITGQLLYADATRLEENTIKLTVEGRKRPYQVKVPEGMMSDIVRPLWDEVVTVKGTEEGNRINLEDIWKA